jgi:NADH-quinone oxidoreductase subunit E
MNDRPSELSKDVAHAMNLFAHPMAGFAAASALGFGLATQAWGLWFGAVAGAMENSHRLGGKPVTALAPVADTVAAVKARAAAVNLMAEAQSLAREVAEERPAAMKPAAPVERAKRVRLAPAAKRAPAAPKASVLAAPAAAKPKKADDLKRIPGIGPKLEQVLNGLGISTYAEIAGWDDARVAWVEDQLGLAGRVGRDGWVAEAVKLASSGKR